jgi:hypothetical protein
MKVTCVEHSHFMALETAVGPVCVTLRRGDAYAIVMVRTALGTDHLRIPMDKIPRPQWYERLFRKWPSVEEVLRTAKHPLAAAPFIRVRDRSVGNSLIKLDERMVIGSHKIGLVYAGAGQSDLDQMLSNNTRTPRTVINHSRRFESVLEVCRLSGTFDRVTGLARL